MAQIRCLQFGLVLGNLLGYLACWWWERNPIVLSGDLSDAYESFGIDPLIFAVPVLDEQVIWSITVVAMTFIVTLWPAWTAMRFRPVEAIRQV